jgi:16S rRNA (adenine1518-N6/adenine1519-N6)-dimethyltransferase
MMCTAGSVDGKDTIVEIGPGKGALTRKLLDKAKKVVAVEKDRDLIKILQEVFAEEIKSGKLELIEGDILEFDPTKYKLEKNKYKIVANIPYNITGAIIRKFLSGDVKPATMVLLVQKEVAQRIVAQDKKESILSLSVKVYGTPKYVMKVGKRFFSPSPKVDSAIISITGISEKAFETKGLEDKFFEIIKAGFAHKRKVLRKNLEEVAAAGNIQKVFEKLSIDTKIRAEDIAFPVWLKITQYLGKFI